MSQPHQSIQQQPSEQSEPTEGRQSQPPSVSAGQQFATRSYLPDEVRSTSIGLLNQALADLTAITMQLKHAHWNVKGVEFYQQIEIADQQGDLDTADLLNEVSRDVTKAQWFVESHLQVPQSRGGPQQQGPPAKQR